MVTRASSVPTKINKIGSGDKNTSRYRKSSNKNEKNNNKTPITSLMARSSSQGSLRRKPSPSNSLRNRRTNESRSDRNAPIILRSSRGNEIGSADTLEVIASKSTESEPSTPDDNINVVVRVRPLNDNEKRGSASNMILQFPGNGQIMVEGRGSGNSGNKSIKLLTYNVVFEPGATQEDVLEYSGIKRIVEMAIEGFSCTAFCYGQTGSGKTHTLTGPPDLFFGKLDPTDSRHGLIFKSFLHLFQLLKTRQETNFILKASYLEIYNEKVIDLLNPRHKPLQVRWSKKSGGFFVENLFSVECEMLDDLFAVLEEGMRNRATGSHQMNEHSSRSHTILTVHIISEQQAENGVFISKEGKVNFVDLAGSEMTKKTLSEGKTLEEANNINKSLMVLGYCIASLSDPKKRTGHIPYRDSQLTKLLADSLAGKGVTLMIACVSPSQSNYAETLNTLRYASRAKRIRTKPIIMMDPREALILSLKRDINALELENDHLKAALNLVNEEVARHRSPTDLNLDRSPIPEAPKVSLEKLAQLEGQELAELVKLYMQENQSLRDENGALFMSRELLLRDQEMVSRENERLLKKLEDVNRACVRSPLIVGPVMSTGVTSSDIWTNPNGISNNKLNNEIGADGRPQSIRPIAENILSVADSFIRANSEKKN